MWASLGPLLCLLQEVSGRGGPCKVVGQELLRPLGASAALSHRPPTFILLLRKVSR